MSKAVRIAFLLAFLCVSSPAHVGSPDIYLDGSAGPYKLFVTIRPPQVIPGVAEIFVRSETPGVSDLKAMPLPLSGAGSKNPPIPDTLQRSASDPQFFTGSLWLMADGSWQVRILATGSQGPGTLSIPVPAIARTISRMDWPLGVVLSIMALVLVGGLVAICGATVREAKLDAGVVASAKDKRKGRVATAVSFCVIALVLYGGKTWWDTESDVYKGRIYQPLNMQASLEGGSSLLLNLSEPGWMQPRTPAKATTLTRVLFVRRMDDLVPDHNHLMHLYAIRQPGLDVVFHLHPDQIRPDEFRLALPAMPAGDYQLYADVVHENGLPETLVSSLHLAGGAGTRPLSGDDASAETKPITAGALDDTFPLPDGYRMRWLHDATPLRAREGSEFRFELLTPAGEKPKDMALYMGMLGHAAFVKTDGSVFAHIHPNGSVAMSAFMLAQGNNMSGMDHSKMNMDEAIPNQVAFPYGLPTAGKYRIFVQMKHGDTVETGVFDATAS